MTAGVPGRLRGVSRSWSGPTTADRLARIGLVSRAMFYFVIGYIAVRIALLHGSRSAGQADAHGALHLIAETAAGKVAVVVATAGLFGFGAVRLAAALRGGDNAAWERAATAVQGLFYIGLAYVPISFLLGNSQTGTEHQQHRNAATVLGFPGGQELVVLAGLVVIAISVWQIRSAVTGSYADHLKLSGTSKTTERVVHVAGSVGMIARALVFLPVGVFLIVAAVQYDPARADGLDGELLLLSRHTWGCVVIALAAGGLVLFALYTLLEARYRDLRADG